MTVVFVEQGRFGSFLTNQPVATPSIDRISQPQGDNQVCDDPYNADCYVGDDEGDSVKPEDLLGPD